MPIQHIDAISYDGAIMLRHRTSRTRALIAGVALLSHSATPFTNGSPLSASSMATPGRDAGAFAIPAEALCPPLISPYLGHARIALVTFYRANTVAQHRLTDVFASRQGWLEASTLLALLTGGVLMMAFEAPSSATSLTRIAAVLAELDDLSHLRLRDPELRAINLIRSGERSAPAIAEALGMRRAKSLLSALQRLTRRLENERDRQALLARPGALENKPLAVLGLHWSVELSLMLAGIETVGQLLTRQEDTLLHIKGIGLSKVQHVRRRLWEVGHLTLLNSQQPRRWELDDSSFGNIFALLALPLTSGDLVSGSDQPTAMIVLELVAVGRWWFQNRQHAVPDSTQSLSSAA